MTADIDADTTGNRTSDTSSLTTTTTTTSQTNNNNTFISTTSSISVSNAVSKIDALLNANNNANNGGIGGNFPRNNGRKLKPLITMPSIEVSTGVADTAITSDVTSDCSSSADGNSSVAAPLPSKKPNSNINSTILLFQRDSGGVDTASTTAVATAAASEMTTATANDTKSIGDTAITNKSTSSSSSVNNNNTKNQTQHIHHHHHHHHQHKQLSPTQKDSIATKNFYHAPPDRFNMMPINVMTQRPEELDGLGPLPPKWEKAFTENGEAYFIDHNTGTSHWLDPRLSKFQKKSLEDCLDDELPYGWEKIHDPQYGTYYIDHVNRRTQYENPVLEAKRRTSERQQNGGGGSSSVDSAMHQHHHHHQQQQQQISSLKHQNKQSLEPKPNLFTKNPSELRGEKITTALLKSSRGLGFTIVGGDDNVEEFLQIKSIVANGQAWLDGKLQTGDILVYVNDICVLGFTHHEMVNVFQSISPGETVALEVCRGYPLPFDPNDPNTEVIQTIAVDGLSTDPEKARILMDLNMDGNYNFLDMSDTSPPTVASTSSMSVHHHGPTKFESSSARSDVSENFMNESRRDLIAADKPEILIISIMKGPQGFGFTIADSAYGQKVKEILDRNCCKNLQVGDYLLAINNTSVMYMSHSAVVQVLKSCPKSEEAILKIQRGHFFNGNTSEKSNRLTRRGMDGGIDRTTAINNIISKENAMGMFRSKTPTADLYSTQPKEILPTRSKTPLVDTRARAKTPLNELNGGDAVDHHSQLRHDDHSRHDTKSNNSFPDQDSINNEVPFIDPFPKMMINLTDRLAETSIMQPNLNNYEQNSASSDYYVNYNANLGGGGSGNGGYANSPIYAVSANAKLPIMAPVPTYHHDHCYCYECQDYGRHQNAAAGNLFNNNNGLRQSGSVHHNDYMYDQHKAAGFSPLESHAQMQFAHKSMQQQQQQVDNNYWLNSVQQQDDYGYLLSEITLQRQSNGFGFRIVGGTEEGSQVAVGHIVPNGAADGNPRIATGDDILSIDGHNVVQSSHHRVVQLMGEAALNGQVTMILRRKVPNPNMHEMAHQHQHQHQMQTIQYPYDVIVSRNDESESFGIVVISAANQYYGSTIGRLIPGSPADRCEELKIGDRIIAVNRIDISGMVHNDVVNLIKESGLHVRLTIGNPKGNMSSSQSN